MLVRYEGKLYLISEDESNEMNTNTLMAKGGGQLQGSLVISITNRYRYV